MPNDSSSRYSSSIEKFINSAIANDYYVGLGVESIGYEDHDTRLNKKVSNVASLIKRVKISEINAAFERNSWSEGKSFKVFDSTDPDVKNSTCYNSSTNELFLCIENESNNLFSRRDLNNRSKFAPSGSNGTIIEMGDGYKWLKINYDPSPISTNYIKIFGIESLQNFKGFTADSQGPTAAATTLHGASGLTYGTCCLYVKEAFIEPITGKTYAAGDILAAYKVPNAWSCDLLGSLTNLQPVFKTSVTGTEYGGFFNISGTAGCAPCDATNANVTPILSYTSGGSAGYGSTNSFKKNYEILSSIPSGCILNAVLNDDTSINYYVSEERPEIRLSVDGNIGSCKAYLKTQFVGGTNGWKVIGIELENQLTSSNITYVEPINLVTAIGSASEGKFSKLLAAIQFNLAPITKTGESYLSVYDLLRTKLLSVTSNINSTDVQTYITTVGATFNYSSAFLIGNVKNSNSYKLAPKVYRDYTEFSKASSTVKIESIEGNINDITFETTCTDIASSLLSDDYFISKAGFDKSIGDGSTEFEPFKTVSSYNLGFDNVSSGNTTGTFELSHYSAYSLGTGGTYYYEDVGSTGGIFQITGVTASSINISDCDVLFATDTTFNESKTSLTLIFNI